MGVDCRLSLCVGAGVGEVIVWAAARECVCLCKKRKISCAAALHAICNRFFEDSERVRAHTPACAVVVGRGLGQSQDLGGVRLRR